MAWQTDVVINFQFPECIVATDLGIASFHTDFLWSEDCLGRIKSKPLELPLTNKKEKS